MYAKSLKGCCSMGCGSIVPSSGPRTQVATYLSSLRGSKAEGTKIGCITLSWGLHSIKDSKWIDSPSGIGDGQQVHHL